MWHCSQCSVWLSSLLKRSVPSLLAHQEQESCIIIRCRVKPKSIMCLGVCWSKIPLARYQDPLALCISTWGARIDGYPEPCLTWDFSSLGGWATHGLHRNAFFFYISVRRHAGLRWQLAILNSWTILVHVRLVIDDADEIPSNLSSSRQYAWHAGFRV